MAAEAVALWPNVIMGHVPKTLIEYYPSWPLVTVAAGLNQTL